MTSFIVPTDTPSGYEVVLDQDKLGQARLGLPKASSLRIQPRCAWAGRRECNRQPLEKLAHRHRRAQAESAWRAAFEDGARLHLWAETFRQADHQAQAVAFAW